MDLAGRTVGGYLVEEGDGGRYRARRGDVEVVLAVRQAPDEATASRWVEAARAARALEHPAAARTLDAGVDGELVWVASEAVTGSSLDELVRSGGPLPATRFVPLFDELCAAVARAGELGMVHGELRADRVTVSVGTGGRLQPRLSAFGAALASETPDAAGDLGDLIALARDVLDGGPALVDDRLVAGVSTPTELAHRVRAASGLQVPAPGPRLEESLRARLLSEAPQPLAEAVAALDAAQGREAILDAVRGVARVLVRYLGALALAARSRGGASKSAPGEAVTALRALRTRTLADGEWLALARDLCEPFAERPELHPVPALPAFVAAAAEPLARVLESTDLDEALADLAAVLASGRFLLEHRLAVPHGERAEIWMGIRRARPLTLRLGSPLPEGWPVILDPSGQPALSLYPLVQVAEPAPGEAAEVFLLAGPGRHGARLESLPSGAILDDGRLWSWFGEHVMPLSAQITAVAIDTPPWRGLLPYGAEHAPFYVGREREAQVLVNRLRVEPIVTVVGAAGAGKTSLVHAGVVPSLPRGWRTLTVRPGATPLRALADAVGHAGLRQDLAADPDALGRALRAAAGDERLLVVIDPFDDLFTRCTDEEERRETALALARAARSPADPVRLLCVVRADELARVEALPGWRERVARGLHVCATPGSDDLVRVLVEPARRSGHDFEDGSTPDALAAEAAAHPDGLARLSLLASKLWERRMELKLPAAAARELGGVGGILERHVEEALAPLLYVERARVPEVVAGRREDPGLRAKLTAAGLLGDDGEPLHEVLRPLLLRAPPVPAPIVIPPPTRGMRAVVLIGLAAAALGLAIAVVRAGGRQARLEHARDQALASTAAAEQRFTDALVERARRSWLAGDARTASTDLAELARRGARGPALALLTTRAQAAGEGERLALRHEGTIWMAGFSPDGTRVVTAGADGVVRLWDAANGHQVAALAGHEGTVWSARFSRDGARLVTAGDDHTVREWDARAGTPVALHDEHEREVLDAVPAGARVVTLGLDGTVRLLGGGAPARTVATGASAMAVSEDERRVVAGGASGGVWLVDLTGGGARAVAGHGEAVLGVGISRDGRHACSGGADHGLRLWDVASGRLLHDPREHGGEVTGCAFSPDGARVATTSADRAARIWDVGSGDLLAYLPHEGEVSRAVFSPDRTRLVTASSDGSARLWDAASGRARGVLRGHEDSVWWVDWAPGGAEVVTASLDGSARVWSARRDPLVLTLAGHGDAVVGARASRDGTRLVTASRDRTARLWDATTGAEIATFAHEDTLRSAELSPDGKLLLTASKDGRARLFPVAGGEPAVVEVGTPLTCARWRPDGKAFVTGAERGEVIVWDVRGARVASLPVEGALDVRFAPDGQRLVVGSAGGRAAVWNVSGPPRLERELPRHRLDVQSVAFSPDGTLVVTAGSDRVARISDAVLGTERAVLRGHTHELRHAEFSPDGALVLTAAGDGTARVWDARTGALLDVLRAHDDWVYSAAFTPDGKRVITAGGDRAARVWQLLP